MLLLISTATFIKTENKEAAKRLGNSIFQESGNKIDDKTNEAIENLKDERDQLQKKLDQLGDETQDNWQDFKSDVKEKSSKFKNDVQEFFNNQDNK